VTKPPTVAVFSPAPLLSIELEPLSGNERARTDDADADVHLHAGGQGFWVARMVRALRARALLCAPFGGESGRVLRALIEHEGVEARVVEMEPSNAAGIEDHRGDAARPIARAPVAKLGRHETDELYTITVGAAIEAGTCAVAGAHNANAVGEDVYRRLVADLVANGVQLVADLSGPPLRAALAGGLPLLKISHEELERDGWSGGGTVDDVVRGIEKLRHEGARDVVVSRADEPAVVCFGGHYVEVRAPHLEVVEPRGAGDSMTAGLAVGLARGASVDDALRLAMAAGALNVTRHGLATGHADAIEQLATKVELSDLAPR
jgi:1-phosphofructokinase